MLKLEKIIGVVWLLLLSDSAMDNNTSQFVSQVDKDKKELTLSSRELKDLNIHITLFNSKVVLQGHDGEKVIVNDVDGRELDVELTKEKGLVSIKKTSEKEGAYRILVPSKANITYKEEFRRPNAIEMLGLEGKLDVEVYSSPLTIKDFSGQVQVESMAGFIDVEFKELKPEDKHSIVSKGSKVRVNFPENPKVDLKLNINSGVLESKYNLGQGNESINGLDYVNTQLNGGGTEVAINAHTCTIE